MSDVNFVHLASVPAGGDVERAFGEALLVATPETMAVARVLIGNATNELIRRHEDEFHALIDADQARRMVLEEVDGITKILIDVRPLETEAA